MLIIIVLNAESSCMLTIFTWINWISYHVWEVWEEADWAADAPQRLAWARLDHRHQKGRTGSHSFSLWLGFHKEFFFVGVQAAGDQEAVGVPEGEELAGTLELCALFCNSYSQDPENKQFFTPDKTMEGIFGDKRQKCFGMSKHLKEHLTNPNK